MKIDREDQSIIGGTIIKPMVSMWNINYFLSVYQIIIILIKYLWRIVLIFTLNQISNTVGTSIHDRDVSKVNSIMEGECEIKKNVLLL